MKIKILFITAMMAISSIAVYAQSAETSGSLIRWATNYPRIRTLPAKYGLLL